MSMVKRISIAFLEFADSSSSSSGQGISKTIHNISFFFFPPQLRQQICKTIRYTFYHQPHLCREYSGRPAGGSRHWKEARPWGTRKDTRRAPTSPPWSLNVGQKNKNKRHISYSNHDTSPPAPVRVPQMYCSGRSRWLDWGWRDLASGNTHQIPAFAQVFLPLRLLLYVILCVSC